MSENCFAANLLKLRGDRNRAEFARFLGIPAPMYHRYEGGQTPKSDNLRVIAERCGVTVDWLLTGNGAPPPATGAPATPRAVAADRPLATPAICRYPAECDLPAQIMTLREEMASLKNSMASMLSEQAVQKGQLGTLCDLLSGPLRAGIEGRVKRKAG